jgi:hypothetical protein
MFSFIRIVKSWNKNEFIGCSQKDIYSDSDTRYASSVFFKLDLHIDPFQLDAQRILRSDRECLGSALGGI